MTTIRKLIQADGTEINLPGKLTLEEIRRRIGAEVIDSFMLPDRVHVVLCDDQGHRKNLPLNQKATELYWDKCGRPVDRYIAGDVIVVPDEDFALIAFF